MSGERPDITAKRRRVLQLSGIAFTGLFGAGAASAKPGRGRGRGHGRGRGGNPPRGPPEWAKTHNDRIELTVSQDEWNNTHPSDVEDIPNEARPIPYDLVKEAFEATNRLAEQGRIEIRESGEF